MLGSVSAARNVGLHASRGDIVAYTDSDCFADRNWLTHLVYQLSRTGAAAVGGPNLTPEDGWLAACVGACPGQPTHVLVSDQVAEHIPGCNMAFRREALLAIRGFDTLYRQAGDDVDLCWRLQQSGRWITFAPGAFVWHHRRQTPRAYLRQQAGYGRAEALLQLKHPDQFNARGGSKWRGVLYGDSLRGLQLTQPIVYRGIFATGLFQCLYQPAPAHWATLPSTLEWHVVAATLGLAALVWWPLGLAALAMWGMSVTIAVLQSLQAQLQPRHQGWRSRLLIASLSYAQPLVRSWHRYKTWLFAPFRRAPHAPIQEKRLARLPLWGRHQASYWTEEGYERTELLGLVIARLNELRWGKIIDTGWTDWDLRVYCHAWTTLEICTTHENHGGNQRLIRVRYCLRLREHTKALILAGLLVAAAAISLWPWLPLVMAGSLLLFLLGIWWNGTALAAEGMTVVDHMAGSLGMTPCGPTGKATPKQ